jgi:hypothetical protein
MTLMGVSAFLPPRICDTLPRCDRTDNRNKIWKSICQKMEHFFSLELVTYIFHFFTSYINFYFRGSIETISSCIFESPIHSTRNPLSPRYFCNHISASSERCEILRSSASHKPLNTASFEWSDRLPVTVPDRFPCESKIRITIQR